MTKPSESISVYGDRSEHFREIRDDIEKRLGYAPTNAETIGIVMSEWNEGVEIGLL